MAGREPLHAMISGLAKGMKTENSSLRFSIFDVDKVPDDSDTKLFELVGQLESRVSDLTNINDDSEFEYKDGNLYTSRLTADDTLNEKSKAAAHKDSAAEQISLKDLRNTPLQLAIDKPGVLSTTYFKQDPDFAKSLATDEVEIEVKFADVNKKDIAILTGRHHSASALRMATRLKGQALSPSALPSTA